MRFTTKALAALGAASLAAAQSPVLEIFGMLSPACQGTLFSLISPNSSFGQCFHTDALLSIFMSNGSVLPAVEMYLDDVCSLPPCSAATLANTSASLVTGCSSDFAKYGISNITVYEVLAEYPFDREVLCLKSTVPPPASNVTANATTSNGTYCITSIVADAESVSFMSVLTSLLPSFISNSSSITPLLVLGDILAPIVCTSCFNAVLDIFEEAFPAIGKFMPDKSSNTTLNMFVEGLCMPRNGTNGTSYIITTNGTLPATINETAVDSTYPYNITVGNVTYPGYNATK